MNSRCYSLAFLALQAPLVTPTAAAPRPDECALFARMMEPGSADSLLARGWAEPKAGRTYLPDMDAEWLAERPGVDARMAALVRRAAKQSSDLEALDCSSTFGSQHVRVASPWTYSADNNRAPEVPRITLGRATFSSDGKLALFTYQYGGAMLYGGFAAVFAERSAGDGWRVLTSIGYGPVS